MIAEAAGWVQALVLGIVQGLTEFIPVSSSAHLVLVPALAGWERHGLAFDVALHLGTLSALLVYYRTDLWGIARAVTTRTASPERTAYRRLLGLMVLGSVPIGIAGLTLDDAVESVFSSPQATAWLLLLTAAVLIGGERLHRRQLRRDPAIAAGDRRAPPPVAGTAAVGAEALEVDGAEEGTRPGAVSVERMGTRHALAVGLMQTLALLPGLSRSGLTISAGIGAGLSRPAATRFAFLLGIPAIAGAAIVQVPQVDDLGTVTTSELLVGVVAAALSGYLAIAYLVRLVSRAGIDRFAWYVLPLAAVSLFILR
ncbi:MAG: undecaprenyl-diphosphate phosphatase [Nitriliruptoraceae bacterium]